MCVILLETSVVKKGNNNKDYLSYTYIAEGSQKKCKELKHVQVYSVCTSNSSTILIFYKLVIVCVVCVLCIHYKTI